MIARPASCVNGTGLASQQGGRFIKDVFTRKELEIARKPF